MYERFAQFMSSSGLLSVEESKREAVNLVRNNIDSVIHTNEDIVFFLKSLSDEKILLFATPKIIRSSSDDFVRSFYIMTFEIFGEYERHLDFWYNVIPKIVFSILYERVTGILLLLVNEYQEFVFMFNKFHENDKWKEYRKSKIPHIKEFWLRLPYKKK